MKVMITFHNKKKTTANRYLAGVIYIHTQRLKENRAIKNHSTLHFHPEILKSWSIEDSVSKSIISLAVSLIALTYHSGYYMIS